MKHARFAMLLAGAALASAALAGGASGDTLVNVGSPPSPFSQNKQNEPAVTINPSSTNILAAGSNDNIDLEACNAGDPTTCPFTRGVGVSGIYFSLDGGASWIQPTYTGWSARDCLGPAACAPHVGPIGTIPWYFENGLVADGDPALAFGPRPGPNGFKWANGSRLYYADLTSNFSADRKDAEFKGDEAIAVSRTDDVPAAAAGSKNAWKPPVLISKQSSATFADKEQIWVDNAESSRFFGTVYVCYAKFVGNSAPMEVNVSRDGGDTWKENKVSPAHNVAPPHWGQSGCTVRTDSHGVVFVFYEEFQSPFFFLPPVGTHFLVQSFDGGKTWTKPRALWKVTDPCFFVDPVIGRCVEDGLAGARNDLSAAPSADIANGAPLGLDATNEIVVNWADGRNGRNNERVLLAFSTNGGATWTGPLSVGEPGDRGYYAAAALSPNGTDLYLVYNAFLTPFRATTADPRTMLGVVRHADIGGSGAPTSLATLHRGATGDPRGSSQNNLQAEFLGDYVYAAATRAYAAAVWNDVRNAADCPAIDAWRQSLRDGTSVPRPAPQADCPPTFGNSDIFGGSFPDPTP